jgi:hypothetical protein
MMVLQPLIELINAFSISILISIFGVDRSIVLDQQKQINRSKSITASVLLSAFSYIQLIGRLIND